MTGDGSEYNSKMVAVTAGDWSIKESDWSWAYKLTDMDDNVLANRTISKNVADMNNRHFEFVGTRLHTLSTTDEHEDVLINIR